MQINRENLKLASGFRAVLKLLVRAYSDVLEVFSKIQISLCLFIFASCVYNVIVFIIWCSAAHSFGQRESKTWKKALQN